MWGAVLGKVLSGGKCVRPGPRVPILVLVKDDPWLRATRDACERAFAFLLEEFGYENCLSRFGGGGFELGYVGPGVGIRLNWVPRDPLTVWLVRTVDGALPPRGAETGLHYFALEDYEDMVGKPSASASVDLYNPSEANALHLAGRLRACGPELLTGGFADTSPDPFPELERRVIARVPRRD